MHPREESIKKMLPKTYLRKHVAHEISVALNHFESIIPVKDKHVYNDGTTKVLICLTGTLPTTYRDKTYHIPISVWVEESYPQTPPICYVRPTRDMMILRGDFISSNGEVLLPYLQEWKQGECDLVSLLQVMSAMFGDVPPVCMQPPPERKQTSCSLQFQNEQVLSKADGSLYLSVPRDDGQLFQQDNETNC